MAITFEEIIKKKINMDIDTFLKYKLAYYKNEYDNQVCESYFNYFEEILTNFQKRISQSNYNCNQLLGCMEILFELFAIRYKRLCGVRGDFFRK